MRVVLLEDIENLGLAGDVLDVKDGYARNFLFPRKLALKATKENVKLIEEKRNSIIKRAQKRLQLEQAKKEQLDGLTIELKAKTGEGGKLFGSIGTNDIYTALKEKQIEIDKKSIRLEDPIKQIGEYEVTIALYRDIKAKIKVIVRSLDEN
ncbi:50S ribosomal protein L9 [Desulfurella multipotens]|uniref:50S ribosomal protein L9 n=1 Tax=Desulfurella multipotens TaxID=79269 RepID=UPI000CC42BD3|nr:50S ribosomal protein L9 [Desulfurella multipotens]PMP69480.1 MAG: 50S ribosomal protein L9 [Desulfurella multipotens]